MVWVPKETDPETSIRRQIIYSGGGRTSGEAWVGGREKWGQEPGWGRQAIEAVLLWGAWAVGETSDS